MIFNEKTFNYFVINLVHAYLQIVSFLNIRHNTQKTAFRANAITVTIATQGSFKKAKSRFWGGVKTAVQLLWILWASPSLPL